MYNNKIMKTKVCNDGNGYIIVTQGFIQEFCWGGGGGGMDVSHRNRAFRDYRGRADKFQPSKCNVRIHTVLG